MDAFFNVNYEGLEPLASSLHPHIKMPLVREAFFCG